MKHTNPLHVYVGSFDITSLETSVFVEEEEARVASQLNHYIDCLSHVFPELYEIVADDIDGSPDDVTGFDAFLAAVTFRVYANSPYLPI